MSQSTPASSLIPESMTDTGVVHCIAQDDTTLSARWHSHDEYELHLITATSGRALVGDWIGHFEPGQLVLTGPRLPHLWVSNNAPQGGVPQCELMIQFPHEAIEQGCRYIPELRAVLPLLERAQNGVEFFGLQSQALGYWKSINAASGLVRFGLFCEFLGLLSQCNDCRTLSHARMEGNNNDLQMNQINAVLRRITDNLGDTLCAAELARELGMNDSRFSRFFRRTMGNTFTDFVNQLRISSACRLLMESNRQITDIGYAVGFNNIANFNRRFLGIKGMTPRQYRRLSANALNMGH